MPIRCVGQFDDFQLFHPIDGVGVEHVARIRATDGSVGFWVRHPQFVVIKVLATLGWFVRGGNCFSKAVCACIKRG